jgi:hypothetical protein
MTVTQYPVIINVRDRLEPLQDLVSWLEEVGQQNIWLNDNASTYEPMVEYLNTSPHHVVRHATNLGHRSPWLSGLVTRLGLKQHFIVTDPDVVPCAECPTDVLDQFRDTLDAHPDIDKVGFSLRLDDLPEHYEHRDDVILWESQFWKIPGPSGYFVAEIDTTFAMYRPGEHHQNNKALRSAPPYTARHMPWYQDSANPTEEQRYYVEHADSLIINWDKKVLPAALRAHLQQLRSPSHQVSLG